MIRRYAVALALAGCVEDVVIARPPATDAAVADRADVEPVATDPSLRIEVTATAEENAAARSSFAVSVQITATRDGVPASASLSIARDGRAVPLQTTGPGRYAATLDSYATGLTLTFAAANGTRHDVPLSSTPIFTFLSPVLHERVELGAAVAVAWSPSGGATVSLLAPGAVQSVPDSGRLVIPGTAFSSRGDHVIRLRRAVTLTPAGLPAGSALTVAVVNSVEIEII